MKALKLIVIAILALTTAALANVDGANHEKYANIKTQILTPKNDWVYVQVEKDGGQKVNIKISNQSGRVFYSQSVKKETKVLKKFDISNLPAGSYIYEVSNAYYSFSKKIERK